MKKFLALLLTALMVLAMFTACAKTATPSQEETTAPTETAEPAAPADETPADAPADDNPFAEEVTRTGHSPRCRTASPALRPSMRNSTRSQRKKSTPRSSSR